jgi:4-carboxymuconolactone decarboxylase
MRAWRRTAGPRNDAPDAESANQTPGALAAWRARGEATCRAVYGDMYDRLRANIRDLHPALDEWMIVEGYGKVLSRSGLDLPRRELCIVAACAASGQDRQLHSHLHGALNVGVAPSVLAAALDALRGVIDDVRLEGAHHLVARVVAGERGRA